MEGVQGMIAHYTENLRYAVFMSVAGLTRLAERIVWT
jgi:hypothetical protein